MKIHLTWIGAAALAAAAFNVHSASAQYAPYSPQQQPLLPSAQATSFPTHGYQIAPSPSPGTAAPAAPIATSAAADRYSTSYTPAAATSPTTTAPRYSQAAGQPTPQPSSQIPAYSYPQTGYPQTAQSPSYPSISNFTTYASNPQPAPPTGPTDGESMPAPAASAPDYGAATPDASAAHATAPSAAAGGSGYPSTGGQAANSCSNSGPNSCGYTDCGIDGMCDAECGGHVWFGGLYWLFMERDNPSTRKLTVRVDHDVAAEPYYPNASITELSTDETDFDFQSGLEFRLGSTFSIGSACDDCGCGNPGACGCGCAPDNYAWEVAWWGLDEDHQQEAFYDRDPLNNRRLYGMVNFAGIEYYDGVNWNPVNDFYGYELPIDDPGAPGVGDYIVMGQRTRSYFSCQNIELNLIRFPVCGTVCGGGGSGCGTDCGYDTCGYGGCGCESECTPIAFSMCGMCGLRYFRIDDDFYYGSQWAQWGGGSYGPTRWINYDLSVDNNLFGPQVGWNMNYCVGCKWNFFCNTTFGIFNNYIESHQRVWGGSGTARYTQTGSNMNSNTDKNDVSFLGELRLGGSYDVSCNWRAVVAYRAVAITGVANSVDQIPSDFTNRYYPGIIDSDASIIVHGLQIGAECKY